MSFQKLRFQVLFCFGRCIVVALKLPIKFRVFISEPLRQLFQFSLKRFLPDRFLNSNIEYR